MHQFKQEQRITIPLVELTEHLSNTLEMLNGQIAEWIARGSSIKVVTHSSPACVLKVGMSTKDIHSYEENIRYGREQNTRKYCNGNI